MDTSRAVLSQYVGTILHRCCRVTDQSRKSTTFQSNNYRTMQTPDALAFHPTAFVAGANSYATTQSPMQSINAAADMLPLQGNFSTTNSFDQDNLHVGYPFNGYHGFSYVPGYTSADFAPLQSADSSSFGSSTASDLDMDMDTAMGSVRGVLLNVLTDMTDALCAELDVAVLLARVCDGWCLHCSFRSHTPYLGRHRVPSS